VASVSEAVRVRLDTGSQSDAIAAAYARGLFKLMAYKDEYEVARLHLDTVERARLQSEFGSRAQVKVLLHPPLLRSLGMNRKIRLGASAVPLFTALRAGRRLRGTALDPFGRSEVRRLERALVGEYRELMHTAIERLTPSTVATVLEIAELPDLVRGYEQIKLAGVARMRERAAALMQQLTDPGAGLEEATMAGYPLEVHRVQDSTTSNPSRR
jgi:indolepyruvate ferredoxin oxidoreductase